jgi:triphosphoribosyl-dephospho-CoA synthase
LAKPGGLGHVPEEDVFGEPTLPLRQVMALAADRDLVARQYANDFHDVLDVGVPALIEGQSRFQTLEQAIIFTQLTMLSHYRDSLILRKRGADDADQARRLAEEVLKAGWPDTASGRDAFAAFDVWLTEQGNGRNPGTSADVVAACLFAALRDKQLRGSVLEP